MDEAAEQLKHKIERAKKMDELSQRVLTMARNTLLVNLRFLDMALSKLEYAPADNDDFDTDGKFLFYNPEYILRRYKQEREATVHDYMHAILHCVFRHMFVHSLVDRDCWNLACDIAVEYTIYGLNLCSARIGRENLMKPYFEEFEKSGIMITAEKLYRYFVEAKLPKQKMAELRGIFYSDTHEVWYMTTAEKAKKFGMGIRRLPGHGDEVSDEEDSDGEGSDGEDSGEEESGRYGMAAAQEGNEIADSVNAPGAGGDPTEQEWKDVSEQMQMDMETFSKGQGNGAGGMMQNLKEVNREKYDYASFLRKFAVLGETMKINDDEFDYIYYTYGLKMYRKVPLIEPLEYKEVKRIREFVIVIDTSGSTSGELVQRFVQKTYNILKSQESFFSKINIHIIQCDAEVQEDKKITCQEDFDEYLKTMKIRGLGGTDFRPAFDYVDRLRNNREFTNLKGLIYFTDGWGTFPALKPDYETAFVFMKDDYSNPDIPPWAIKLVLEKEDI